MNWESFQERLGEWLAERDLLREHMPWVLGVSGGPDSTLLLHALIDLSRARNLGWELHVAHLHHGLRERDADADAVFVRELAQQFNLAHHQENADIPAEVSAGGGSTEEVARQRRYDFLERVALHCGSDCVAVAHHADDDAETILHRICRGTGLRGLAGMPELRSIQTGSRVRLVRPLLHFRRNALLQLARERGLTGREDATNDSSVFTRGRIRSLVLPLLRDQLNPNVVDALLRLGEQARWLGNYLEDAAARTFDSLVVEETPGLIVLNTRALLSKQRIIQAEVVRRAIALVAAGEQDLAFNHVDAVLRLAADRASGKELHLPGPTVVRKVYDRLEFRPLDEEETPAEFRPTFMNCPGITMLPQLNAELRAEFHSVDGIDIGQLPSNRNPYEEWLDAERIRLPLLIRGRKAGDRFWPLGAPGSKSLSDFFIERKVDPPTRCRIGVVCDQDGPVWVMPLRIDERVKLRPTSRRALRLILTPGRTPPIPARPARP